MGAVVLYTERVSTFIQDAINGEIEGKLSQTFEAELRHRPSLSERRSWRESLLRLGGILSLAGITDAGVSLEYQLPVSSRRLDVMIAGKSTEGSPTATIIELKQWEKCAQSDSDSEIVSHVGGHDIPLLHPSIQVGRYLQYLADFNRAFSDAPVISLEACAFLHNYDFVPNDPLLAPKFAEAAKSWPLYCRTDHEKIKQIIRQRTAKGEGLQIIQRIQHATVRPTIKFLEHAGEMIRQVSPYKLLDNQVLIYDRVLSATESALTGQFQAAIIAKGGPGTGKSVIALQLMGKLTKGLQRDARYVTGSGAFTKTLKKAMGPRAGVAFEWTNAFVNEPPKSIDVLLVDEAHRIRDFSTNRIGQKLNPAGDPQIDEILRAARVSVFFIDDMQGVTPTDSATSAIIRERAQLLGIRTFEYDLDVQFRCGGMDEFLPWVEDILGIRPSGLGPWRNSESFEFRIFDTPEELERAVLDKVQSKYTGRLMAGYCWPWSSKARPDGTLEDDVRIGSFHRPWNARESSTRLARGIPKGSLWAYSPGGENQIGCVYTAQGFEFDYAGVIFGPDLRFDSATGSWVADPGRSCDNRVKSDKAHFSDLVKRTYRVLLSRGLNGCFVYFVDESTRKHFESGLRS